MSLKQHYIDLHADMHHRSSLHFTGKSLRKHISEIDELIKEKDCRSILDYGCGKAQFWPEHWKPIIQGYDPAYSKFNIKPKPADMVICTDVMEHIPEDAVEEVLKEIDNLTIKWVFFSIDTNKAKKKFKDGTNVHVTIKPAEWWKEQLNKYCPRHTVDF